MKLLQVNYTVTMSEIENLKRKIEALKTKLDQLKERAENENAVKVVESLLKMTNPAFILDKTTDYNV